MIDRIEVEVDEYVVHLYLDSGEAEALLKESARGKGQQLVGPYFFRKDKPHSPPPIGQYHLHVYKKQNELFSINWDGSGHDNSKGCVIPLKVHDALQEKFPDLNLPASRVIESLDILGMGNLFKVGLSNNLSFSDITEMQCLLKEAMGEE